MSQTESALQEQEETLAETEKVSFAEMPIGDEVKAALDGMGYTHPTDVQAAVLEAALAGKDIVVQAQTGSGKTLAFGIPLLEKYEAGIAEPKSPKAVVLAPTRELAHQVAEELRRAAETKGNKVFAVYGGVPLGRQVGALKSGIDILVATPGRLLDHIRRKNLVLDQVESVILDEADEMLSMGFWDDVTDILGMVSKPCQTMLFSATLPYQIAKAAAQFLIEPDRIDVSGDDLTVDGIRNCITHVKPDIPKPRQLLAVLEHSSPTSAIVFCNTRSETEVISKYLCQNGFIAEAISGNFRQKDRERVMGRIKNGDLKLMVATDIAARGIDITDLSHVFNYSLPEFSEVYLHRVGRTGRAGRDGVAISLVDGKGLGTYSVLERQFGITFEEVELPAQEEVARIRSARIMQELKDKASVAEVSQHVKTAEDICKSEDGANLVAYLLKSYFNAQVAEAQSQPRKPTQEAAAPAAPAAEQGDDPKRSRRRRRRRRRGGERQESGSLRVVEGQEAAKESGSGDKPSRAAQPDDGFKRLTVNVGFDDGFKGRGAVAKKITSLAGLNDGIVSEVESKRHHALLKTTPEVAELLIERVDGAQIGKKILSVELAE